MWTMVVEGGSFTVSGRKEPRIFLGFCVCISANGRLILATAKYLALFGGRVFNKTLCSLEMLQMIQNTI